MTYEEKIRRNKIRRTRELRRNVLIFTLVSVFLILILSVTVGSIISKAQASDQETYYKYYTSIEIQAGDTLWSLAEDHAENALMTRTEFLNEVSRTNHLLNSDIREGEYLVIPYCSAEFK